MKIRRIPRWLQLTNLNPGSRSVEYAIGNPQMRRAASVDPERAVVDEAFVNMGRIRWDMGVIGKPEFLDSPAVQFQRRLSSRIISSFPLLASAARCSPRSFTTFWPLPFAWLSRVIS